MDTIYERDTEQMIFDCKQIKTAMETQFMLFP